MSIYTTQARKLAESEAIIAELRAELRAMIHAENAKAYETASNLQDEVDRLAESIAATVADAVRVERERCFKAVMEEMSWTTVRERILEGK